MKGTIKAGDHVYVTAFTLTDEGRILRAEVERVLSSGESVVISESARTPWRLMDLGKDAFLSKEDALDAVGKARARQMRNLEERLRALRDMEFLIVDQGDDDGSADLRAETDA